MLAEYLFLRFKDGREIRQINPPQTLMNLQHFISSIAPSLSVVLHMSTFPTNQNKRLPLEKNNWPESCLD